MVLGHARPWLFELIAKQATTIWPGAVVQITLDRPTGTVIAAAERAAAKYPGVEVLAAPFPAVADREYFMELRNWQLDQIRRHNPEFVALWDDDHILERPREVAQYLRGGFDLVYIRKLFFWDTLDQFNTAIPEHNSVLFFRVLPDDRYPLDRVIHAPLQVHDSPLSRKVQVTSRLLDVGYLHQSDRERVFKVYARAGKLDAATLPLMNSPTLREYKPEKPSEWYLELKKAME